MFAVSTKSMQNVEQNYIDFHSKGRAKCEEERVRFKYTIELMRRAAEGLELALLDDNKTLLKDERVLIFCGVGNNGGDGYALAEILASKGVQCAVLACGEPKTLAAQHYSANIKASVVRIYSGWKEIDLLQYTAYVDCVFGIGFHGELSQDTQELFKTINSSGGKKIACDIPSGLSADNGKASPNSFRADITVSMAALKVGQYLNDGMDYCGKVICHDIGIDDFMDKCNIVDESSVKAVFPKRSKNVNKGNFGNLVVVAGSQNYVGAGVLAYTAAINIEGEGAMRSGCGYCRLCVPDELIVPLQSHIVHCCLLPRVELKGAKPSAIVMGMGMDKADCAVVKSAIMENKSPLLLDATALDILADNLQWLQEKSCDILLTPHPKEFARLSGISVQDILSDPIGVAKSFASKYGVTVYLKGTSSVVTDGERVSLVVGGVPSLAKGGSGDVLSGMIGSLMAQGNSVYNASCAGGYLHAKAAKSLDINEYSVVPMDIAKAIVEIIPKY